MAYDFEKILNGKLKSIPNQIDDAKVVEKAIKGLLSAFKAQDKKKYLAGIKALEKAVAGGKKKSKDTASKKFLTELEKLVQEDVKKRSKTTSSAGKP